MGTIARAKCIYLSTINTASLKSECLGGIMLNCTIIPALALQKMWLTFITEGVGDLVAQNQLSVSAEGTDKAVLPSRNTANILSR